MKSVLISIQPKWCKLIAEGKKTVEVRKTKPKIDVPFKCYIYCTQGDALAYPCLNNPKFEIHRTGNGTINGKKMTKKEREQSDHKYANGKVIGEFVCDKVYDLKFLPKEYYGKPAGTFEQFVCENSCLSFEDIKAYRKGKSVYAWHITDLVIYDEPRELGEFIVPFKIGCCNEGKCRGCKFLDRGNGFNIEDDCNAKFCTDEYKPLRKAPQSWCYVEELGV